MKTAIWLCVALLVGGVAGWKARDGEVSALERQVHDWSGVAVDAEFMMPKLSIESNLGNYQSVWLDQTTGKIFWCPSVDDCKWRDRSEVAHLIPYHPYYVPGPDRPLRAIASRYSPIPPQSYRRPVLLTVTGWLSMSPPETF